MIGTTSKEVVLVMQWGQTAKHSRLGWFVCRRPRNTNNSLASVMPLPEKFKRTVCKDRQG